ncbi:MAG: MBL fold metallo-hydrolase [Candidatus Bipolaricaulota bacterium]|nr:MBL fold metallo-hydrolase [Candidatus Bipolaricaulota bacterium]
MSVVVHQIAIPNPYFEGPANAFLIQNEHSPAVLIDTGIGTEESLGLVRAELARHGCALKDIAAILLTHKHVDHCGLARALSEESGAAVYVHRDDWTDVAFFDERHEEVSQLYLEAMRRWGIPDEIILQMAHFRSRFVGLARSVPAAHRLDDGQTLRFGELAFRVLHTPGHTQGSACFLLGEKLFTGDHLLPTYTSNVGATDVTSAGHLGKFLSSLHKVLALPNVESLEVFPGHGRPWRDPRPRITKIFEHHDERTERILKILSDGGALTAFQIAQKLFGRLKDHHVLLGAGEVYAHLEGLESAGRVRQIEPHRFQIISELL